MDDGQPPPVRLDVRSGRLENRLRPQPVAVVGQFFIGTAFGVMYAGALAASLAFFAQSVMALAKFLQPYLGF